MLWLLIPVYSRVIKRMGPGANRDTARPGILMLNARRFIPDDVKSLSLTGQFRLFALPFRWQAALLAAFYPRDISPEAMRRPDLDERAARAQRDCRAFLMAFLPRLYRRLKIRCVISAAVHYRQDLDWGAVSSMIGAPFIVLHKENLATAPGPKRRLLSNFESLGRFQGDLIIVHNEVTRQAMIDSGFVDPDRVYALGCLRMDSFLGRLKRTGAQARARATGRRKVTLFSFHKGTGLWGVSPKWPVNPTEGLSRLFERTHATIARFAKDHPDIDVVIKPKWGGQWIDEIVLACSKHGIDISLCPNVTISADLNASDLILESDVVISYGSTTLLEAAIARKPVIMPLFDEATKPEYADYVQFRDELDLFDIAHSPKELVTLILKRLADPAIDEERQRRRLAAFERNVSPISSGAAQAYARAIMDTIQRQNREEPSAGAV